jgi:IS1 family transposase
VAAGDRCERIMAERVQDVPVKDVQADEIWGFVGKKESNRVVGEKNFDVIGDAWTFIAVERETKLVLAFELGRRDIAVAERFMNKLARATGPQRFQLSTDGLPGYPAAVGRAMNIDDRCDDGQVIKPYRAAPTEEQRRYDPATIASIEYKTVYGTPSKRRICTSHIERQSGSLRQSVVQAANAVNLRLLKEVGQPESRARVAPLLLQFLPCASHDQAESRDGLRPCGSLLDDGGVDGELS